MSPTIPQRWSHIRPGETRRLLAAAEARVEAAEARVDALSAGLARAFEAAGVPAANLSPSRVATDPARRRRIDASGFQLIRGSAA